MAVQLAAHGGLICIPWDSHLAATPLLLWQWQQPGFLGSLSLLQLLLPPPAPVGRVVQQEGAKLPVLSTQKRREPGCLCWVLWVGCLHDVYSQEWDGGGAYVAGACCMYGMCGWEERAAHEVGRSLVEHSVGRIEGGAAHTVYRPQVCDLCCEQPEHPRSWTALF